jgi:hypothetical protein
MDATYDATSHPTTFPAMAVRPAAALPTLSSNRAWSLTDTGRPASPHFAYVAGLQVREEGEHYLPDLTRRADDEEYQADPELSDAAWAHTGNVRRALKLLDDGSMRASYGNVSAEGWISQRSGKILIVQFRVDRAVWLRHDSRNT